MNDAPRRIEIFTPFGEAYELMKKILFEPFDLTKWLALGFAAFLSGAMGGGPSYRQNWGTHPATTSRLHEQLPSWFWPAIIPLIALGLVLLFIWLWITARGRFIFIDCIVRNRAAIVVPWREYRREGNSLFEFSIGVFFVALFIFGGSAALFFAAGFFGNHQGQNPAWLIVFIPLIFLWVICVVFFSFMMQLIPPVMYRRRCYATEAFGEVLRLVLRNLGVFILFILFSLVIFLAFFIVSMLAGCATCCLAFLPYLSSVVLLPALIWMRAFVLCFLRQFGTDYDLWATLPNKSPLSPPDLPAVA